eukprot:363316-Chlamydomonas_euryale.AAC.3
MANRCCTCWKRPSTFALLSFAARQAGCSGTAGTVSQAGCSGPAGTVTQAGSNGVVRVRSTPTTGMLAL